MTDGEKEHENSMKLAQEVADFIKNKNYTHEELTYGLLYAALALNLESEESMQFLEEAFIFEVLPLAKYKSCLD